MALAGGVHRPVEIFHQGRQVGVDGHDSHVVGGVEPPVDAGDRRDAGLGLLQGRTGGSVGDGVGLHPHERRHQGEAVGDPVVDLAQEQLGPVARLAHLGLGPLLLPAGAVLEHRGRHRLGQQFAEVALEVLPDVVDRAGLERGDGDAAVLRAGDVDDRRRVGQRPDARQDVEAGLARHVVVEGDDVEALRGDAGEPGLPVGRMLHRAAPRRERATHQPRQPGIVVDVEQADRVAHRHALSGTCITEKNSPSWRIALAKPS